MLRVLAIRMLSIAIVCAAGLSVQAGAAETAKPLPQRAVLVTGATSGIGRHIAEHLANKGYYVYAGARKQADINALNAIPNIEAVRLDVTKPDEIAAAVETVRARGRGLHGLVNNAGAGLADEDSPYADDIAKWIEFVAAMETPAPDAVAEAAQHALFSAEPKRRYLVVPNEGEAAWIMGSLVTRLAQFNGDHEFSYSTEDLLAMVRAAIGADN